MHKQQRNQQKNFDLKKLKKINKNNNKKKKLKSSLLETHSNLYSLVYAFRRFS